MPDTLKPLKIEESPARESAELAFCFAGLMGAYLVWGLLQEKIMTQVTITHYDDLCCAMKSHFGCNVILVFFTELRDA